MDPLNLQIWFCVTTICGKHTAHVNNPYTFQEIKTFIKNILWWCEAYLQPGGQHFKALWNKFNCWDTTDFWQMQSAM